MENIRPRLRGVIGVLQNVSSQSNFSVGRPAPECEEVSMFQSRLVIIQLLREQTLRSEPGLFAHERMVHQEQCLWCDSAHVACSDNHARVRKVERFENLRQRISES